MSKDKRPEPQHELHEMELELLPIDPGDPKWRRWFLDLHVAIQDLDAVLHDQLRKERKRDLGPREARRLYREARDTLRDLLATAGGGGGGDDGDGGGKGGNEPAAPANATGK